MNIKLATNRNALITATVSFILGTVLLILFLTTKSSILLETGLFYVAIASIVNGITLLILIINAIRNQHYFQENLFTILIFLLNIPITIGYFYIVANTIIHKSLI